MSASEREALREIDVLIVEDEPSQRLLLGTLLEQHGLRVLGVATVSAAREALADLRVGMVLTDFDLPDGNGLAVLEEARAHDAGCPVGLVTAYGTVQLAVDAMRGGAVDVLLKPVDPDYLVDLVQRALRIRGLERENRSLRHRLQEHVAPETFVAESAAMREVVGTIERVASTRASVLITGESGVGKEWVARLVHGWSMVSDGPFIATHCAALPESLLEAELFGHAAGAFTGATHDRRGLFEEAEGGSLFLDEVGEFPPAVQVRLLRVLQEKEVTRLGESSPRGIDARVIAATNRDLEAEVEAGRFREDLFYRLDVVRIEVPPLRQRPEDIAPLVEMFSRALVEEDRLPPIPFTPEAVAVLQTCPWKGNVRELRNVVARTLLMATGDEVRPEDLPTGIRVRGPGPGAAEPVEAGLEQALAGLETRMIREALAQSGSVQTRAASLLGIPERVLRYKMRKHGIRRDERTIDPADS